METIIAFTILYIAISIVIASNTAPKDYTNNRKFSYNGYSFFGIKTKYLNVFNDAGLLSIFFVHFVLWWMLLPLGLLLEFVFRFSSNVEQKLDKRIKEDEKTR